MLNILLEDLLEGHAVSETKLKEVLGHTPIQVGVQISCHKPVCLLLAVAVDFISTPAHFSRTSDT